jgi:hypothetical protein
LTGSDNSGLKRRFASRHIQDAGCFRIPKNTKIFVSVAIENGYLQNEYENNVKPCHSEVTGVPEESSTLTK